MLNSDFIVRLTEYEVVRTLQTVLCRGVCLHVVAKMKSRCMMQRKARLRTVRSTTSDTCVFRTDPKHMQRLGSQAKGVCGRTRGDQEIFVGGMDVKKCGIRG